MLVITALSPLESCPSDILWHLVNEGDFQLADILNLRLTSRSLNAWFTPFVKSSLHISVTTWGHGPYFRTHKNTPFIPTPDAFAPYIKRLEFGVVVSFVEDKLPQETFNEKHREIVHNEIRKFKNLQTLQLNWILNDNGIKSDANMDSLINSLHESILTVAHQVTNGQLSGLSIVQKRGYEMNLLPDAVTQFRNLTSFNLVRCGCWFSPQQLSLRGLKPQRLCRSDPSFSIDVTLLLRRNPRIETINWESDCPPHYTPCLQHIFNVTVKESQLRSLRARGIPFSIMAVSLPSFPYLQELHLQASSKAEEADLLWSHLERTRVTLRSLTTSLFSNVLVHYLCSYRDKLETCVIDMSLQRQQAAIVRFLSLALGNHASSLQCLGLKCSAVKSLRRDAITRSDNAERDTRAAELGCTYQESHQHWPVPTSFASLKSLEIRAVVNREGDGWCQDLVDLLEEFPKLEDVVVSKLAVVDGVHGVHMREGVVTSTRTGRPKVITFLVKDFFGEERRWQVFPRLEAELQPEAGAGV
ncbi:hypothetical protein AX16_002893 [Volvariella volvacea WC 439]|nr:hypothetical protein AX16_002893 [Volvariella volvacea WC 439]